MATFLTRSYDLRGYKESEGLPPFVDVGGGLWEPAFWVPWAVTIEGRVVYAPLMEARGRPAVQDARSKSATGLWPYTSEVSQSRRGKCHTMLGLIALSQPDFSRPAVEMVSANMRRFLMGRLWTEATRSQAGDTKKIYAENVGKYLYGTSYMSFGRISDTTATSEQMWHDGFTTLIRGRPLETILNIHDGVGRAFFAPNDKGQVREKSSPLCAEYAKWYNLLRADKPGELFHTAEVLGPDGKTTKQMPWRGRKNKPKGSFDSSTLPGNLPAGSTLATGFTALQSRNRGVDMYERIQPAAPPASYEGSATTSGNNYFADLDQLNELFGAGPSGTTGTTLAAAFAFGGFSPRTNLERTKEYLFAIIGYLVGGGMHTLNESLAIVRLLGLEYHTGSLRGHDYSRSPNPAGTKPTVSAKGEVHGLPIIGRVTQQYPLLPVRFLNSPQFEDWRDEFYDIVVLGGTHWRFNTGPWGPGKTISNELNR